MSKIPADLQEKWAKITKKCYADQAKWVMNGFFDRLEKDAESIWVQVQKFSELDQEKHAAGSELDEFWSHKFLETLGETMTVIQMREKFRGIDLDVSRFLFVFSFLVIFAFMPRRRSKIAHHFSIASFRCVCCG